MRKGFKKTGKIPEKGFQMKKMTAGQKMRWVAGGLYLALALFQMFAMRSFIIEQFMSGISMPGFPVLQMGLPWLLGLAYIPVFGAMAIWMFAGKNYVAEGARRAVVVGSLLVVAYELMTYDAQVSIVQTMLYSIFKVDLGQTIWNVVIIAFRLLLIILAAFFVTSAHGKGDSLERAEEAIAEAEAAADAAEEAVDTAIVEVAEEMMAEAEAEAETIEAATEAVLDELAKEEADEEKADEK